MAEIATIARPYAEALFKAHGSEAASTSDWLDAPRLVTHLFQNVKHIESLPKGGVPEGSP